MPRKKSVPPGPHYAIYRIQLRPGIWFWLAAFRRCGKHYYKSFYDVRRGGPEKSLAAAIAWRDERLAKAKAPGKREFSRVVRSTNTSGVSGVQFVRPEGQPEGYWQARLKLSDGREITRAISVRKYGERAAFRMAVQARAALLETIEDTPFVKHPLAKAFCARQTTPADAVAAKPKPRKARAK